MMQRPHARDDRYRWVGTFLVGTGVVLLLAGCTRPSSETSSEMPSGLAFAQSGGPPMHQVPAGPGGMYRSPGGGAFGAGASSGPTGPVSTDPKVMGTEYVDKPPTPADLGEVGDPFGKFLVPVPRPPKPKPPTYVRLQWMPPSVPRPSRERELISTPPNVERKPAPPQLGRFAGWMYNSDGQVVAIFEDENRNSRAVRVDDLLMVLDGGRMRQMRVKAISPEYLILVDQATGDEREVPLLTDLNAP